MKTNEKKRKRKRKRRKVLTEKSIRRRLYVILEVSIEKCVLPGFSISDIDAPPPPAKRVPTAKGTQLKADFLFWGLKNVQKCFR